MSNRSLAWLGPIFVLLIGAIIFSVYTVPAGHVGVLTRFGAVHKVVYPGIGIKMPFVDFVHKLDVRTQLYSVDTEAASKDMQVVTSTVAVNYHIDGDRALELYQNVGRDYKEILIEPTLENVFKDATAKYAADQLIITRNDVKTAALKMLKEQLAPYNIVVENLNIVNFDFSPEFNDAIEKKVTAQQEVERAKQELESTRVEAEKARVEAQGIADAQKMLKDSGSLTPEYLQYLAIQKWNGVFPLVMSDGMTLFNLEEVLSEQ